ncbi:hypothetical protein GCM10017673_57940 [Streptosporangium violaceochromogenes]|nr:hypothetical protein GCM10017673_57940 [Streptosporangium violaceochromogenes]
MTDKQEVTLYGSPLDGMVLPDQPVMDDPGVYMIVPGTDRRAVYDPRPGRTPRSGTTRATSADRCAPRCLLRKAAGLPLC